MERTLENLYRILVVDDEPENVRRLTDWLRSDSFAVSTAADGPEALEVARRETPDLILLDRALPSVSGEAVARELKRHPHLGTVPIIMLTNGGGLPAAVELLEQVADDLITDPTNVHEVRSRIRTMLKKRDVYLQLEQANQELKEANSRLQQLLVHDEKTTLLNYRAFNQRLQEEFRRARRYHEFLSLIMLDLDHYKVVNDRHGHPSGDEVLREFGRILTHSTRETDLVARFGGDEFVVLLPATAGPPAFKLAERIRQSMEGHPFQLGEETVRVTSSQGIATFPVNPNILSHEDLVRESDKALYLAKEAGRNRSVLDPRSIRS